jgi:hypothetical protein
MQPSGPAGGERQSGVMALCCSPNFSAAERSRNATRNAPKSCVGVRQRSRERNGKSALQMQPDGKRNSQKMVAPPRLSHALGDVPFRRLNFEEAELSLPRARQRARLTSRPAVAFRRPEHR